LWAEEDKVNHIKTEEGHQRYRIGELATCNRRNIIYARVSPRKQEGDLQRQIDYLRRKYPNHEIVKDIGSGLNFKRLGFKKILDELFKGNIKEVVVASSDRWCR
jgi:predicted site-specific integrase-resolvase